MAIEFGKPLLGLLICLSAFEALHAEVGQPQADRSLVLQEFEIPTDGDLLVVPVVIAGRTYQFVIDTSCYCTCFDSSMQSLLGRAVETRKLATPSGSVNTKLYSFPEMLLGRIPVSANNSVGCIDLVAMEKVSGVKIDGLIGSDVLSQYVVRLDFDCGRLAFLEKVGSPVGDCLSLVDPRLPTIEVELPGFPRTRFLIDTGSVLRNSGSLHMKMFSWLELKGDLSILGKAKFTDASSNGLDRRQGVASRFSIAGFDFTNTIWDEHTGRLPSHVGLYFLTQFNITFDFPNAVMYLTKSKHFGHADLRDLSGLHFRRVDGQVVIEVVDEGSPAEQGGVKANDH